MFTFRAVSAVIAGAVFLGSSTMSLAQDKNHVTNHGGPVLTGPLSVQPILLGSAWGPQRSLPGSLTTAFINSFNAYAVDFSAPSPYGKGVLADYYYDNARGNQFIASMTLESAGTAFIVASPAKPLTSIEGDANPGGVIAAITSALNAGAATTNGLVNVIVSPDVVHTVGNYHSYFTYYGTPVPFTVTFLQGTVSGGVIHSVDTTASFTDIIAFTTKAITNPFGNGWYDINGKDIIDKCVGQDPSNYQVGQHYYTFERAWIDLAGPLYNNQPATWDGGVGVCDTRVVTFTP